MKTALLLLAFSSAAWAQTGGLWSVTSFTLDGGGASSTGGGWAVTGTIGQPDASTQESTGGEWAVTGGFWPGIVALPDGPALVIFPFDANNVTIAWTSAAVGYKLQYSTDLAQWTDYPGLAIIGGSNIVWPLRAGPRHFFRLREL